MELRHKSIKSYSSKKKRKKEKEEVEKEQTFSMLKIVTQRPRPSQAQNSWILLP